MSVPEDKTTGSYDWLVDPLMTTLNVTDGVAVLGFNSARRRRLAAIAKNLGRGRRRLEPQLKLGDRLLLRRLCIAKRARCHRVQGPELASGG